ncbi:uncharacterized protein LOC62_01G001767 [Vanrija pseudolonga]|uniref:Uncharacterized protein n=1 Tax=Vanrija pseudolonga TaxID=143232 RepID=A0AAF0Y195_9TREE|nr:hypothetical protein LOC62_01G001767 [Vanrija pseudolonga]
MDRTVHGAGRLITNRTASTAYPEAVTSWTPLLNTALRISSELERDRHLSLAMWPLDGVCTIAFLRVRSGCNPDPNNTAGGPSTASVVHFNWPKYDTTSRTMIKFNLLNWETIADTLRSASYDVLNGNTDVFQISGDRTL